MWGVEDLHHRHHRQRGDFKTYNIVSADTGRLETSIIVSADTDLWSLGIKMLKIGSLLH